MKYPHINAKAKGRDKKSPNRAQMARLSVLITIFFVFLTGSVFSREANRANGMILIPAQTKLVINEFMADNQNAFADPTDLQFDDWLELYNGSTSPIHLKDYFLTDNPAMPTQWPFPDLNIQPGEFLLIWADNHTSAAGLHASFKLSKAGEFLGLYARSGSEILAVDTLTFTSQLMNVSFGRFPDGSPNWQFLSTPTPGASNQSTAAADSSAILFDDSKIHRYELHFYVTHWADSLAYYYAHGEQYFPARLTAEGLVLDSIGVRYKGNSSYMMSRRTPKKPFKFKFNKYKKDQTFFDVKELNFSNSAKDPSFMREKIGYDIARTLMPAPRAAYANIYVDNELIGLYVQVEQVDKTFLQRYFKDNDGNLYKASDKGTSLAYLGTNSVSYKAGLELKTNEDEDDWSGLITLLDRLNHIPAAVFQDTMENYLNLDRCCRLLAFNMVLSNFDSYTGSGRNFYLYDDPTSGQFQIIPWDLNETFGAYINNWNIFTVDIVAVPNLQQRPLNRRILENESLRQKYLGYIQKLVLGPAAQDSISARAEKLKTLVDPYVQADNNKLYSYQNFLRNIEADVMVEMGMPIPGIKSFSARRNENLKTQLDRYLQTTASTNDVIAALFKLNQNYPNPFNPTTTIAFTLAKDMEVKLEIFNTLGQQVATLFAGKLESGPHALKWQAMNLPGGIYYAALKTETERQLIKMVLLK